MFLYPTDHGDDTGESGADQQLTVRPQMLEIGDHVQPQSQPQQTIPEGVTNNPVSTYHGQIPPAGPFIGPDLPSDPNATTALFQMRDVWPPEIVDSMVWSV